MGEGLGQLVKKVKGFKKYKLSHKKSHRNIKYSLGNIVTILKLYIVS